MAPPGFHLHFLDNLLCFQNKSASTFQAAQRHSCLGRPDLAMSQQDVPVEVFAAQGCSAGLGSSPVLFTWLFAAEASELGLHAGWGAESSRVNSSALTKTSDAAQTQPFC